MLTRITLNGSPIAHGHNLTSALEQLAIEGHAINPDTVMDLYWGNEPITDEYGTWDVEKEPAFDGQMIRQACESGDSFIAVQMDMEGRLSNLA